MEKENGCFVEEKKDGKGGDIWRDRWDFGSYIKNHQYQSSLSEDSYEDDLSDLYGKDDDYSEGLGNIYYLNTLVSNYINKGTMLSNPNLILSM